MCMKVNVNGSRNLAVTGQVGKSPSVFIWDTSSGEKINRFKLQKTARAVAACAISPDGDYIATADKHNDHNVSIYKTSDPSTPVFFDKTGGDEIYDLVFDQRPGSCCVWSGGQKHFMHWDVPNLKKKKGIFYGSGFDATSFPCLTADDQGNCYAGGANALIYIFNGNTPKKTLGFHE